MRLASIRGITSGIPKTAAGVVQALRHYETINADLDPQTRRMLGLCALASYFGRRRMEEALGKLPSALWRDISWRWWNVLVVSGLADYWDGFAEVAQSSSLRDAAAYLRRATDEETYLQFLRRAGTNPYNSHRKSKQAHVWTKGGTWHVDNPFCKIIVLGLHLERPFVQPWQKIIGEETCRLLERELHHSINPDKLYRHECIAQAIQYVRWRLPQLLKRRQRIGPIRLAWFFQHLMPDKLTHTIAPTKSGGYVKVHGQKHRALRSWRF